MDINLQDWFGTHLAILWLSIGVLLLALEPLRRDLTMVMLTLGAAAAVAVSVFAPHTWWLQLLVGVVVGGACVALVRPRLQPMVQPGARERPEG